MAPPSELSPQMLQQLRQQIDAALATPPAPPPAVAAAAAGAPDFCAIWPGAKPILQFLVGIVAFLPIPIPGGGPAAAAALNALMTVGDQIYRSTCPH
jgi:hypothetical protein